MRNLFIIVAVLIPLALIGDNILRHVVILPSFRTLEKQHVKTCVTRCVDAIHREAYHLGRLDSDWAHWDDTYAFVKDKYPAYIESNLQWPGLSDSGIDMVLIYDIHGRLVWRDIYNPSEEEHVSLEAFSGDHLPGDHPLLQHPSPDEPTTGMVLTEHGAMLISSCTILTTEMEGPGRGTLIMGRFLSEDIFQELAKQVSVDFSVKDAATSEFTDEESVTLNNLSPGSPKVEIVDRNVVTGYGVLVDMDGRPALLISANLPRDIMRRGVATSRIVSVVIAAAFAFVGAWLLLWLAYTGAEASRRQARIEALVEERTAALRESEKRFRVLADNLPGVVYLCRNDERYTMLYLNEAVEQLTGRLREEFLEDRVSFVELYHPDDAPGIPPAINAALAKHEPYHITYRLRHRDGQWRWTEEWGTGVYDGDNLLFLEGFLTDITERKKTEEAVQTASEEWQRSFDALSDYVCILDTTGAILRANRAMRERFEPIHGNLTGQDYRLLYCGTTTPDPQPPCAAVLQGGAPVVVETTFPALDGHYLVSSYPLRNPAGELMGAVSVVRDITREIQIGEQLRQAQKMEAIGQLAGGIAHDFNNLLHVILSYSDLALEDMPATVSYRADIEEVKQAAKRAAALTGQLLAFSRRQVIQPVSLDLNESIGNLLKMIRRIIGEHINLDFVRGHSLGMIHADPGQMEQVLMNLCINARDAMPGGGKLTLETENVLIDGEYAATHPWAVPGRYVLLSVTDTGCGIAKENLARIFDPFFTTKDKSKGTGMGLATVYGIVKQHNGHINVYSEVGKGSLFKIYLPIAERRAAIVENRAPGPVRGGSETILLAEDDEAVLALTERILRDAGYTVLAVKDGLEAVRMFKEHSGEIDLALFDVVMPRMGGKEAMERIQEQNPDLPHLFASGYSENAVHTGFIQKQGLHLIRKPYQRETLLRAMREVLDG